MNNWDKTRVDNIYKQKLHNVKSTMQKVLGTSSSQNSHLKKKTSLTPSYKSSKQNEKVIVKQSTGQTYQKQQFLKRLLREFGLQQYLRKMYELGYDDSNLYKLAFLSHKEYEEFLLLLKIFPGHQVKMVSLFEYLKRIYVGSSVPRNEISTRGTTRKSAGYVSTTSFPSNTKRFHSVNNTNRKNDLMSVYGRAGACKPHSVGAVRSNEKIVKSFCKGDGFGFNYYIDDNSNSTGTNNQTSNIKQIEKDSITSAKIDKSGDPDNTNKSIKDEQINHITDEIDKMLEFYMKQLNEKLDQSYDSLEGDESSLSNCNSINPIGKKPIKNEINLNNVGENTISISEIKSKPQSTPTGNISSILEKNNDPTVAVQKGGDIFPKVTEMNNDEIIEEEICSNNISKSKKNINENLHANKTEASKDIVAAKNDTKQTNDEKTLNDPQNVNNNNDISKNHLTRKEKAEEEDDDDDYYSNVRLVKSCEENYIRQNMDQFDIEYMCRCLGLAVMKHIESGKEKQHIMDLVNFAEDFTFFNSIFNANMDFLFNFFNKENHAEQISNLDRLDLKMIDEKEREKEKLEKNTDAQTKSAVTNENKANIISFVTHFKSSEATTENEIIAQPQAELKRPSNPPTGEKQKLHEIEKDMKLIDEFFTASKRKYQNMNENTKNIMCKELSYIGEVDSGEYVSIHQINSVEKKIDKEQVDYANLLKQSIDDVFGKNEEDKPETNENVENANEPIKEDEELEEEEEQPKAHDPEHEETADNKFISYNPLLENQSEGGTAQNIDESYKETPYGKIQEDIQQKEEETFESGTMESNYIIDATTVEKLKAYILKQIEIYDDDYSYQVGKITSKRFVPPPDPQGIFEFCANIMVLTKMEKEVIIVSLIYLERLIFNTGVLLNSRNWKRIIFTAMLIASKIWDDDSFENNHFAQVFTHLKIGEINLMERSFLELINYKVYVKCSEYFKYFFIIKSIALKYNYNGINLVPISVEKMMKIQEYAYLMQKRLKKKYSCHSSAQF